MPGPQTQHKGTVYGDDENAPKPGLGPPVRRRPQHAHRRTSRSHPPRGMTAPRARPARRCAYAWGAVHVDTIIARRSYPSSSPIRYRPSVGRGRHSASTRRSNRHLCRRYSSRHPTDAHRRRRREVGLTRARHGTPAPGCLDAPTRLLRRPAPDRSCPSSSP